MKTIITAVAAAGLLSLAACGGGSEAENTATANETVEPATGLENEAGNIGDAANTTVNGQTDTLGAQANALENGLGNAADATSNAVSNAANATGNAAANAANTAGNTL